jgi:hypothetical protein
MKYRRYIFLTGVCLLLVGIPSCFYLACRQAESDVRQTVEKIRLAETQHTLNPQTITNLSVGEARIYVRGTAPLEFTVGSLTPWPDLQIYEYDSRTPEKGIYHYSF